MTHIHGCYRLLPIHAAFCFQAQQEQKKRIQEQQKLMAEKKKEDSSNPSDDVSWVVAGETWICDVYFFINGRSILCTEQKPVLAVFLILRLGQRLHGGKTRDD